MYTTTPVDWDSPTWGRNPVHRASDGSWVPDRHSESSEDDS